MTGGCRREFKSTEGAWPRTRSPQGSEQPSRQVERDHHVDNPAGGHEDPEEQAEEHQRAGLARGLLSLSQVPPGQGCAGLQRDQRSSEWTQIPCSLPVPARPQRTDWTADSARQSGACPGHSSRGGSSNRGGGDQLPGTGCRPDPHPHSRPVPHHLHNHPEFDIIVGPSLKMSKQRLREVK